MLSMLYYYHYCNITTLKLFLLDENLKRVCRRNKSAFFLLILSLNGALQTVIKLMNYLSKKNVKYKNHLKKKIEFFLLLNDSMLIFFTIVPSGTFFDLISQPMRIKAQRAFHVTGNMKQNDTFQKTNIFFGGKGLHSKHTSILKICTIDLFGVPIQTIDITSPAIDGQQRCGFLRYLK